jgi:hypothetical protein
MLTPPPDRPPAHVWYTPEECASLLQATRHGAQWRARCPAHGGDNPTSLAISAGEDRNGNPVTLLYCFAHQCKVEDICAAMGIEVVNLFCIQLAYGTETRHRPRARSPRIQALKKGQEPATSDEIAQILLEEMIVSDPMWIQECAPARQKMWELAQASPHVRAALTQALRRAHILPLQFWDTLAAERRDADADSSPI